MEKTILTRIIRRVSASENYATSFSLLHKNQNSKLSQPRFDVLCLYARWQRAPLPKHRAATRKHLTIIVVLINKWLTRQNPSLDALSMKCLNRQKQYDSGKTKAERNYTALSSGGIHSFA